MSTTDPTAAADPQFATVLSTNPTQSIPDLIWYLKSSFRDSDFDLIQQVLVSREQNLTQSNNELSSRIVDLELRHRSAVEELQRVVIEKAEKVEEGRRWRRESEGLREEVETVKRRDEERKRRIVELVGRCREAEGEARAKGDEIRVLKERNRRFEAERREVIEKEEEIRVLVERNRRLEEEKRESEKVKEDEVRVLAEKNVRLEEDKREFEKEEMVRVVEERCKGLEEEKAKVEAELETMKALMNGKVSNMVEDVRVLMAAYKRVSENGGGGGEKEAQDAGRPPVQKAVSNELKEDDGMAAMSLRKKLLFSPEVSHEYFPSVAEKPTPIVPIILYDTDDDDDKLPIGKSLKRKRTSSEPANPSSAASSISQSEKKFIGPPPGFTTASALRKCDERLATESEMLSSLLGLDATNDQIASSDSEDEPLDNPVVSQLIASCRKSRMSKLWEHEADLLFAFDRDPELCAKAVCAMYRQDMKLRNGPVSFGSGGFSSTDVLRGTALAKFLIDGDPDNKMKKSASDLKQHDPKGLEDLQRLAKAYSRQLFGIYQRKDDPLFP